MAQITSVSAKTVQINTQEHSWGIFCFNELGDLFLNSDWGVYAFSWRSFGGNFQSFLAGTNEDYIVQKFENNFCNQTQKPINPHTKSKVLLLTKEFINHLKKNSE